MSNKLKCAFIGAAALLLVGCGNQIDDGDFTAEDFAVVCLDGTEYWMYASHNSYKGYMGVRIDRETRQPKTCG